MYPSPHTHDIDQAGATLEPTLEPLDLALVRGVEEVLGQPTLVAPVLAGVHLVALYVVELLRARKLSIDIIRQGVRLRGAALVVPGIDGEDS